MKAEYMKFSVVAAALLCLTLSCRKVEEVQTENVKSGTVYISFEQSKSLMDGVDSQLGQVDIFVYDKNGMLRAQEKVSGSTKASVPISVPVGGGKFSVYVIGNPAKRDLSDVATEEELLNTSSLLSESVQDDDEIYVEMLGKLDDVTFVSGQTYPVALKRTLSKVRLEKICISLPDSYAGWRVRVDDIYLVNANIRTDYRLAWTNPYFVNKSKLDKSGESVSGLLQYGSLGVIENGESVDVEDCNLYCYPNPTTIDSSSSSWCPRYTRLVVETVFEKIGYSYEEGVIVSEEVIAEYPYYYPVNIIGTDGKMNPNTSYIINTLTITGPGSDSPDVPIVKGSVSVSMTVADWVNGFKQSVVY